MSSLRRAVLIFSALLQFQNMFRNKHRLTLHEKPLKLTGELDSEGKRQKGASTVSHPIFSLFPLFAFSPVFLGYLWVFCATSDDDCFLQGNNYEIKLLRRLQKQSA